jgi:GNAT superfamily N-acetyltransferase
MTGGSNRPVILGRGDGDRLDSFLMTRAESSLMLLSNMRSAGIVDNGSILSGTYAAYTDKDAITGVAAHYWNGMAVLQAPEGAAGLLRAVLAASGRDCTGIAGPYDQVQQALSALPEKTQKPPAMNGKDTLFALDLDAVAVPDILHGGKVTCRHPSDSEVPTLTRWRIAFMREHVGPRAGAAREAEAYDLVRWQQETGNHWVLETGGGTLTATAAVSAGIPGMVQVGGVYTVPEYRNRGYGRAVVAGALLELRGRGVKKAILFTGTEIPAAVKMYRALGFRPIGEYGLVIFQE